MPKLTNLPTSFCKVCIAFVLIYCHTLNAQRIHYTNYTVRHGLPSNKIYNIIEDRNGFIWLATDRGASRFDGISFTNFSSDNGLPDNDVLKILEDSVGRIWFMNFATEPGYYFNGKVYNADNDSFLAMLKKTKGNKPCTYVQDIITKQLYFRVPEGKGFILVSKDNKERIYIGSYTGTDGISPVFIRKYYDKIVLIDGLKLAVLSKTRFNVFIYPRSHLGGYDPVNDRFLFSEIQSGKTGWIHLKTQKIEYLAERGTIFPALSGNKVVYLLKKNELAFIKSDSAHLNVMLEFAANSITVSKNGNIWLTSPDQGFYLIRHNFIYKIFGSEYTSQSALSICSVGSNIYVGTDGNGLIRCNGERELVKYEYLKDNIRRINGLVIAENTLYSATDNGLLRLDKGLRYLQLELPYSVKDIENGYTGEILVATAGGLFRMKKDKRTEWQQLLYDRTTAICCLNDSLLWYGRLQGLYYCYSNDTRRPAKEHQFITNTTLDHSYINDIKKDLRGNVWISTNQNGLFFYNPKCGFVAINNQENNTGVDIASNICKKIFVDSNNTIWVANAGGLVKIVYHLAKEKPVFSVINYTKADGLPDAGTNDVMVINGQLIIATATGCYRFLPVSPSRMTSQTLITGVAVNGNYYPAASLKLQHYQNNIIVNFAASFIEAGLDQYHFKYMIKGLNTKWIHIRSTQIPLSGLAPGKYDLMVAAVGNNGQSGPITHLNFTILSPWYKTTWFGVTAYLCLASIGFFFLRREKKRMETSRNLAQMELKVLRSQMDPHFIFNSLNSIQQHLFKNDFRTTNDYMSKFASLLRSNLHYSALEMISLKEEILFIHNYLELEQFRFEKLFEYTIELIGIEHPEDIKIPAFMVQPLLENTIKHGFISRQKGGLIHIKFILEDPGTMRIEVSDNGIGIPPDFKIKKSTRPSDSAGLSIIEQRIQLLQKQMRKNTYQFLITKKDNQSGTLAILVLPAITPE